MWHTVRGHGAGLRVRCGVRGMRALPWPRCGGAIPPRLTRCPAQSFQSTFASARSNQFRHTESVPFAPSVSSPPPDVHLPAGPRPPLDRQHQEEPGGGAGGVQGGGGVRGVRVKREGGKGG